MINSELFKAEQARALAKYSPAVWSTLDRYEMWNALSRESNELNCALWANDVHGEHGAVREAIHCAVVAIRIAEEMQRRGQSNV